MCPSRAHPAGKQQLETSQWAPINILNTIEHHDRDRKCVAAEGLLYIAFQLLGICCHHVNTLTPHTAWPHCHYMQRPCIFPAAIVLMYVTMCHCASESSSKHLRPAEALWVLEQICPKGFSQHRLFLSPQLGCALIGMHKIGCSGKTKACPARI